MAKIPREGILQSRMKVLCLKKKIGNETFIMNSKSLSVLSSEQLSSRAKKGK